MLDRLWKIATADPAELVEFRRGCCRHCWGAGFRRQETAGERERRLATWQADAVAAEGRSYETLFAEFDEHGGIGFNATRAPHPDCPECFGEGEGRAVFKDVRQASPAARVLFAGVRETSGGRQVITHDQLGALTKVGDHLGMFVKRQLNTNVSLEEFLAQLDAAGPDEGGAADAPGAAAGEPPQAKG